jgi:uncharacterized protein (DUF2267 family)
MSVQGSEIDDPTVRLTQDWVEELRDRLGWASNRDAMRLMRAVLVELRDRLPPAQVADLGQRMPLLIRGMYYDGWHPARPRVLDPGRAAFDRAVAARLGRIDGYRGAGDIDAVLAMLANRTGPLPDAIRPPPGVPGTRGPG